MHLKHLPVIGLSLFLISGPLYALDATPAKEPVQQLVDEINQQIERASKERLADPWFLKDLQQILAKYDNPWEQIILKDDFSARGPAPDAPWQVESGEFLIDWRHGLRSVVTPQARSRQAEPQKEEKGDLAAALLGALIESAIDKGDNKSASRAEPEMVTTAARVTAPLNLPNSFAMRTQFTLREAQGLRNSHLILHAYQAGSSRPGYRLHMNNANQAGEAFLTLTRLSSRGGEAVLELSEESHDLIDGAAHELVWVRDASGQMRVALDGKQLISVRDRSFRDAFNGVSIENQQGDVALREFELLGGR